MKNEKVSIFRRDFIKALSALPFLGYFAFRFRENIMREAELKHKDYLQLMGIERLDAPGVKLTPGSTKASERLRLGIIGNG